MSIHLSAKVGDIAETVLLAGDPLRAKWVAENFLENRNCYNTVRNMLGYTGETSQRKRVSIQGSGMGMPSLGIYVNELIDTYGVKQIIRIGTAGSLQKDLACRSVVLAMGSCSDSFLNHRRFEGMSFAPIADWSLLHKAHQVAQNLGIEVRVGNIFATDKFYDDAEPKSWQLFAKFGVIAIEMETAELYTVAAQKGIQALTILTISDNLVTGDSLSSEQRERGSWDMMKLALSLAL